MNLMDLFIKIAVKDEASDKISKIAGGIGQGLKAAAKVGAAAVGVAASGIAALTTAAVKNYAEYEQLVGGVETLFKDSAERVQNYAANAYKSAGISANEYMSTVTSFSASLLQSLGGDTEAAADLSDRALRDMSDNANKMGTDMNTIIATYQSLSRGNYAMLDNLKLGYGGTKAEMERLIATAAEMDSSVKANDMSFGNMVKAIGAVQDSMGITGTTALEASTTISGSVNSMKAAWSNLLVGIADDTADFDGLVNDVVESAGTAMSNVLPRITVALQGAAKLITQILPQVIEVLPQMVTTVLPQMAKAAVEIVLALVNGIVDNSEMLITSAMEVINVLVNGIVELLPQIIDVALQLIIALAQGLSQNAPTLIPAIVQCVVLICEAIMNNAPMLLMAGVELIGSLLIGLVNALPTVLDFVITWPQKMSEKITENLPELVTSGKEIVSNLLSGIQEAWGGLVSWVADKINAFIGMINEAIAQIGDTKFGEKLGIDKDFQLKYVDWDSENKDQPKKSNGITVNQYIDAKALSPAQLMVESISGFERARWAMT